MCRGGLLLWPQLFHEDLVAGAIIIAAVAAVIAFSTTGAGWARVPVGYGRRSPFSGIGDHDLTAEPMQGLYSSMCAVSAASVKMVGNIVGHKWWRWPKRFREHSSGGR